MDTSSPSSTQKSKITNDESDAILEAWDSRSKNSYEVPPTLNERGYTHVDASLPPGSHFLYLERAESKIQEAYLMLLAADEITASRDRDPFARIFGDERGRLQEVCDDIKNYLSQNRK